MSWKPQTNNHRFRALWLFALITAALLATSWATTRDLRVTLQFDYVKGLQTGDAVYLQGVRIGSVHTLQPAGRRVEVELTIENRHQKSVPADSRFLLTPDELNPSRRSITILPGQSTHTIEGSPILFEGSLLRP